jgi:ribonuclease T2
LSAHVFFDTVRKARAMVKIPADYLNVANPITVTPGAVAEAFITANPGLSRAGLSVSCDSKWLSEVRLCLGKDLAFRDCPDLARRSCQRETIVMPAMRGGRASDPIGRLSQ